MLAVRKPESEMRSPLEAMSLGSFMSVAGALQHFYQNEALEIRLCHSRSPDEAGFAAFIAYLEANRRFFLATGDISDGFFFGNDFGTQLDLLISPESFREFVFPYFRQLTDLGHEFGKQVILHSCGSIYKVIPDLIDLGVDALHPLQAKAANMEAERLGSEFGGAVAFVGGLDTQELLVHGTPDEVRSDVKRVAAALGPKLVVSPSHEALLPNVPPANVVAMAEAVGAG